MWRERAFVPALFGGALAAFVLQTVFTEVRSEPYPALTMPAFGAASGSHDEVVTDLPTFEITFDDGSMETYNHELVVGEVGVLPYFVVKRGFDADDRITHDRRTAAWLRSRLDRLAPGRRPVEVVVVWTRTTFELPSGDLSSVETRRRVTVKL